MPHVSNRYAVALGTESQPTHGIGYDVHSQILLTMEDVLGTDVLFDEQLLVTGPPSLHPADDVDVKGYEDEVVVGSATFAWNQPTTVDVELHTYSDITITSIDASQSFQASPLLDFGKPFELQRIELRNSAGELVTEFDFESDLAIDYVHFATVPEPSTLVLATMLLAPAALLRRRRQPANRTTETAGPPRSSRRFQNREGETSSRRRREPRLRRGLVLPNHDSEMRIINAALPIDTHPLCFRFERSRRP